MPNLDSLCAQYGYDMVHEVAPDGNLPKSEKSRLENTITKSLGVLQENGLYAFFLYLEYRKEETGAPQLRNKALELLCHNDVSLLSSGSEDHFQKVRVLTQDLDKVLLARQLLEQMLIYARYHAKALREGA